MKDQQSKSLLSFHSQNTPPWCDHLWNPHFEGDAPIFQFRPADAKSHLILDGAGMLKGPKMPDASKVMNVP